MTHPLVLFKQYDLGFIEMTLGITADSICLEIQGPWKASELSAFIICKLICHQKPTLFDIINRIESNYIWLCKCESS